MSIYNFLSDCHSNVYDSILDRGVMHSFSLTIEAYDKDGNLLSKYVDGDWDDCMQAIGNNLDEISHRVHKFKFWYHSGRNGPDNDAIFEMFIYKG